MLLLYLSEVGYATFVMVEALPATTIWVQFLFILRLGAVKLNYFITSLCLNNVFNDSNRNTTISYFIVPRV